MLLLSEEMIDKSETLHLHRTKVSLPVVLRVESCFDSIKD